MARPLRILVAGGLYHVVARGNERKAIFRDDADREFYLRRLAHYREKFGFAVWAYCLMDNHVHLAIETGVAPLSRVMAGLQSSYTQGFNRRHHRAGHLFQGRYKAFLVEKDRYALALVRYIHENPVRANMVRNPGRFRWSSDRDYRRGGGPAWLDVDRVLSMLGPTRSAALRGYQRLMGEDEPEVYEEAPAHGQIVKGGERFADRMFAEAKLAEPRRKDVTAAAAARVVGSREGVTQAELRGPGRGRRAARARLLSAWAAREVGGVSLAASAQFFNRDTSTIARGVDALEQAIEKDPALRARVEKLARALRRKP